MRIRRKPIVLSGWSVDHLLDNADGCAIRDKDLLCIRINHVEIREFLRRRLDLVNESLYSAACSPGFVAPG